MNCLLAAFTLRPRSGQRLSSAIPLPPSDLGSFESNVDAIDHLLAFNDFPSFQVNAFGYLADGFVNRRMEATLGKNVDQHLSLIHI